MQNVNANLRPKLIDLLECPFFNHDFIKIYSFLTELPLKTDDEKAEFFTSLPNKLNSFNEVAVASQLGGLLLSRLVLLNKTAQKVLLPLILCPQKGNYKLSIYYLHSYSFFYIKKTMLMDFFLKKLLKNILLQN